MKKLKTVLRSVSKELLLALAIITLVGSGTFLVANSKVKPTNVGNPSPTRQAGTTLSAEKTAEGFWEKEYEWSIEKEVSPNEWDLFNGDSATSGYELKLVKELKSESGPGVKGTIYVFNGGERPTEGLKIKDVVQIKTGSGKFIDYKECPIDVSSKPFLNAMEGHEYPYECLFEPVPGAIYRNTAFVTITNHSGWLGKDFGPAYNGGGVKADFTMPSEQTIINDEVTVKDIYKEDEKVWENIKENWEYDYDRTFTCDEDDGEHINTVYVYGDNNKQLDSDSATLNINCYDIEVSKDAETSYTRTFDWMVDKSVDEDTWHMFKGDSATSNYIVDVTKDEGTDSAWMVKGKISITNPAPMAAELTNVQDLITYELGADVEAEVDCDSMIVPAKEGEEDGKLICSYTALLDNASDRLNTATATLQNYDYHHEDAPVESGTTDFSGTADVKFGEPTTLVNDEVKFEDAVYGDAEVITASKTYYYNDVFTCVVDEGAHKNTATIYGKDVEGQYTNALDSDSETVNVYCYLLNVSKDAETSYTRTFAWTVDKSVDKDIWHMFKGDSATSNYTVDVTKDEGTDSDWMVKGEITVTNPAPINAKINSVSDVVSNVGEAEVTCSVSFPYYLSSMGELTCDYELSLNDGTDRTNTATATLQNYSFNTLLGDVTSGTTDFSGTADVKFGEPTTLVNDEVKFEDAVYGDAEVITASKTYHYDDVFACEVDEGAHQNTATIYGKDNQDQYTNVLDSDSETVNVYCYLLSVSKDAETSYTRTWNWDIDKTVDPADISMFAGETPDVAYEVSVDRIDYTDSAWMVKGKISITNPAPMAAELTNVHDLITYELGADVEADVNCDSMIIPAKEDEEDGKLVCSYTASLDNASDRLNTATATLQNYSYQLGDDPEKSGTTDFSGTADVKFGEPKEVYEEVTVTDTNWPENTIETVADDASWPYTEKLSCPTDTALYTDGYYTFEHDNTATITETEQTADATVTVNCYMINIEKTADTAYTRNWTWEIEKTGDQTALELEVDESGVVNYQVTVDANHKDSEHNLSGKITIHNPATIDAVIKNIKDIFSYNDSSMEVELDCGEFDGTLTAGESLVCNYAKNLEGALNGTNTVTVYQEKNTYDSDGLATPIEGDGTPYSASAEVDFAKATVTEIDEKIDVDDDKYGYLGAVYGSQAPKTFYYPLQVGPYEVCGEREFTNTATFVTNDTATTGKDSWTVLIDVPCLLCEMDQTAWASGNDYIGASQWATYVTYEGVKKTVTLYAGQTYEAGTVTLSAPHDGYVTITIVLNAGWEFQDVENNVKVQDYATAPSGNPAVGNFAWKKTASGDSATIVVPENNYYGIHVDVFKWVKCD
jgi:hypothetical protein